MIAVLLCSLSAIAGGSPRPLAPELKSIIGANIGAGLGAIAGAGTAALLVHRKPLAPMLAIAGPGSGSAASHSSAG